MTLAWPSFYLYNEKDNRPSSTHSLQQFKCLAPLPPVTAEQDPHIILGEHSHSQHMTA